MANGFRIKLRMKNDDDDVSLKMPFMDLEAVLAVETDKGVGIVKGQAEITEKEKKQLFEKALENTKADIETYTIEPPTKYVFDEEADDNDTYKMLVCKGTEMQYAGNALVSTEPFRRAAKLMADHGIETERLFIIPSSVWEVLIVPDGGETQKEIFNGIIKNINETQVKKDEWLSNHVYVYNVKTNTITW